MAPAPINVVLGLVAGSGVFAAAAGWGWGVAAVVMLLECAVLCAVLMYLLKYPPFYVPSRPPHLGECRSSMLNLPVCWTFY